MAKWTWGIAAAVVAVILVIIVSQQLIQAPAQAQAAPMPSLAPTATPVVLAPTPAPKAAFNATKAREKLAAVNESAEFLFQTFSDLEARWGNLTLAEKTESLRSVCDYYNKMAPETLTLVKELNASGDPELKALADEWSAEADVSAYACGQVNALEL